MGRRVAPRQRQLQNGVRVDSSMLADIQRMQMQPKRAQLAQERIEEQAGQPLASVADKALAYQTQIVLKFCCAGVRMRTWRHMAAGAQARAHVIEKAAVNFRFRNSLPPRVLLA